MDFDESCLFNVAPHLKRVLVCLIAFYWVEMKESKFNRPKFRTFEYVLILYLKPKMFNFSNKHLFKKKMVKFHLKPSLSTQWSLVRSFLREFFCIRIVVWLWSQGEVSRTKLMQKKSSTKLRMRLHWLERLGWSILLVFFLLLIHYQLSCQKGFASIQLLFECNYVFICSVHLE